MTHRIQSAGSGVVSGSTARSAGSPANLAGFSSHDSSLRSSAARLLAVAKSLRDLLASREAEAVNRASVLVEHAAEQAAEYEEVYLAPDGVVLPALAIANRLSRQLWGVLAALRDLIDTSDASAADRFELLAGLAVDLAERLLAALGHQQGAHA